MTIIQSIILGIVEGFTEFLPISSTAHMEFAARILQIADSDFLKSFEIIIQFGAILAVVAVYGSLIWKYRTEWKKFAAAFVPTALVGFALYKIIKTVFLGDTALAAIMLVLGGLLIFIFDRKLGQRAQGSGTTVETMTYRQAALVGLAQSIAVVPGVSRSGATIYGGLFAGISREAIIDFSFILAVPTMLEATGYDLLKNASGFSGGDFSLLAVGFVAAFLSALVAIRFFISYAKRNEFTAFGVYRILAGVLFLVTLR